MLEIKNTLKELDNYITKENYKGYDPYDTLNSFFPFHWFTKGGEFIAIQLQKRNPINIRPLLGIKKTHSPKGMGLLLNAYLNIYSYNSDKNLISKIEEIKNWLIENKTYYNGSVCWGYEYPYTTPEGTLKKGFPTVIHHSYIIKALFNYYLLFKDEEVYNLIIESQDFVIKQLKMKTFEEGVYFSYNPISEGCCYNATMHAAEVLARIYSLNKDEKLLDLIIKTLDFVTKHQKKDGVWYYSFKEYGGHEKKQIDFHQGFILESYHEVIELIGLKKESWNEAIIKGLNFYLDKQFFTSGRSLWRLPHEFPVEIHNQAQGIITFTKLSGYNPDLLEFAYTITKWTISNMYSNKGYFYYRKNKFYTNKIPYMRWSQSWMLLAMSEFIKKNV